MLVLAEATTYAEAAFALAVCLGTAAIIWAINR